MAITNKYFINLLTFTSLVITSCFYDAPIIALATPPPISILALNANLSTSLGLSSSFITGSTLEYNAPATVEANIAGANIRAVNLNRQDVGLMKFTGNNISLGSVVSQYMGSTVKKYLAIEIDDVNLTLIGTSSSSDGFPSFLGFASGINFAPESDYSALGNISFVGTHPILTIKAPITLNGRFSGTNIASATLNINDFLKVTDQTVVQIATINITDNSALSIDATTAIGAIDIANSKTINLQGVNSKLQLTHADKVNDHTFTLSSNIVGKVDNQGIVELTSDALGKKLIINPSTAETLGGATMLKELIISGVGTTEVNVGVRAQKISISGTGNVAFSKMINSGVNGSMLFGQQSNVEFNEDTNITNISFADKDGTIKVNAAKRLTSNITANDNTVGTIEFADGGELDGVVSNLKMLKAGRNADVKLASGNHNIAEIRATGSNKLILSTNFNLNGKIDDFSGGNALDLNFQGNGKINGTIGETNPLGNITILGERSFVQFDSMVKCNTITIDNNSTFKASGDIIANRIISRNATIHINDNIIVRSNLDVKDTTLDIGSNTVTYNGAAVFVGDVTLHVAWDIATKDIGHIIVEGMDSHLNLSNSTVIIHLTSTANIDDVAGKDYALLKTASGGTITGSPSVILVSNEVNGNVVWSYDPETYSLVARGQFEDPLMFNRQSQGAEEDVASTVAQDSIHMLIHQAKAAHHVITSVTKATVRRLSYITNLMALNTSTDPNEEQQTGVSAGEEASASLRVWGSVIYSISNQKSMKEVLGYHLRSVGKSVGIDTMINDSMLLGTSITRFNTDINGKLGNITKTKVGTSMISLYGSYWFQKNFFVQGIFSFSVHDIKQRKINSTSYEVVKGKYRSNSYEGEVIFGYNHTVPKNFVISPMTGVRYTKFNDPAYTETGTSSDNLSIAKKSSEKLEVIAGLKIATMAKIGNGIVLMPELHGFINHTVADKSLKLNASVRNSAPTLSTTAANGTRTVFNTGVGLSLKHHAMEYNIGYDVRLSKGYVAHQGVLKISVQI